MKLHVFALTTLTFTVVRRVVNDDVSTTDLITSLPSSFFSNVAFEKSKYFPKSL
ncbi:hypothetical protein JCM19055_4746 [Geomicrobium sp. JCM 19055]|nr:hypothetical protein JCM19055_4746 [Geomicrobium sp. JCM 19055]